LSECSVCWYEKNPDEFAVEVSAEYILREFKVCAKHKEVLMSACGKCGSQSTTFKEGISKKTGKKWAAYACDDCKEMNWIQSVARKTENGNQVPQLGLADIKKQLDRIEKALNIPKINVVEVSGEEESPF
jgi:hypothetical protein